MDKKLKTPDEKIMILLCDKILQHCNGRSLAEVACFVGTLSCGTLHRAAELAHLDVKQYLLDFADTLRSTIEETLKDYSFKP